MIFIIGVGIPMVPGAGLEPARCLAPADFESAASTNFATPALKKS